jgi:sodium transport system permease protein
MLIAVIPGMLATGQDVRLSALTALLPIANVALAVRDGLVHPVPSGLLALVAAASVGWGYLAMRWTTHVLSREDTILGFDPEPMLSHTRAGRRRAAFMGMSLTVLVYFYVGTLLQTRDLVRGLLVSLWVLLPILATSTAALAWSGGRVTELLSLRRPSVPSLLAGLCLGAGLVIPMVKGFAPLQSRFLPSPEALFQPLSGPLEKLSVLSTFLLLAVSPGICEELTFRGVFLGTMRRLGSTRGAVLVSAAFFALIHLSVFRFLPTFLLGILLATVVVRTGSIFASMVLHAAYNGGAVLLDRVEWLSWSTEGARGWLVSVALLAVGVAILLTMRGSTVDAGGAPETAPPA